MTPTGLSGLLMWGQAGTYDGVDDRMVIEALSGRRQGIIRRSNVHAAATTGLEVIVPAWNAVVECADGTHAVIGSRDQQSFTIAAGPATGQPARVDNLWADIYPDDPGGARWELNLISNSEMANRAGVRLATITAPPAPGGNTASGMTFDVPGLTFGGAGGILARATAQDTQNRNPSTFAAASALVVASAVQTYAGRIYKVRGSTVAAGFAAGTTDPGAANRYLRMAVCYRVAGQAWQQIGPALWQYFDGIGDQNRAPMTAEWSCTMPDGVFDFGWKMWAGAGTFRVDKTGQQEGLVTTVEDAGPTHQNWNP